jgi:hypothetical protein
MLDVARSNGVAEPEALADRARSTLDLLESGP